MSLAKNLSNIALAATLGASASAAYATDASAINGNVSNLDASSQSINYIARSDRKTIKESPVIFKSGLFTNTATIARLYEVEESTLGSPTTVRNQYLETQICQTNMFYTACEGQSVKVENATSMTNASVGSPVNIPYNPNTNSSANVANNYAGGASMDISTTFTSVSITTDAATAYKAPEPIKENHDLGYCNGPAYQALWQAVESESLTKKRGMDNLVAATPTSFTLRQYRDAANEDDRALTAGIIQEKLTPKLIVQATVTNAFAATGGNATGSSSSSATSAYASSQRQYTDVTYHCRLGK